MTLPALLWDVDGTLAETERDGHRVAFNRSFAACGLAWEWDVTRYGALLAVTGGFERLLHDFADRDDAPRTPDERESLARSLHRRKNAIYADLVRSGGIPLRPGVAELLTEARRRGHPMAIVTTTGRDNVDVLLRRHLGADWADGFDAIVCGEDVLRKKPDPQAHALALARLGLAPAQALALEDSPPGATAAVAAGLPVVVTRSAYFAAAPIAGAIAIGPGLDRRDGWQPAPRAVPRGGPDDGRIRLDDLLAWHGSATGG